MKNTRFGIEIEFTGITRSKAAQTIAEYFGTTSNYIGSFYDVYGARDNDNRTWKVMSDGSIATRRKVNRTPVSASKDYSCELVSPILTYEHDINTLQEIIRRLRKAGAMVNSSCGIHIHLDGADHNVRSLKNFINIIASKNDLFYTALQIKPERMRFCKKMDEALVEKINRRKPKTLDKLEDLWYEGYHISRDTHYHESRYHFLNLHSFFTGNHTVELRGFNSTLHAGEVRSYIVLALALNQQALTQKRASAKKPQTENQKFAMRTYLNRIGLIGDEFEACREHLTKYLTGSAAWRFGA